MRVTPGIMVKSGQNDRTTPKLTAPPVFRVEGVDVDREMTYKLPQEPRTYVTETDNICSDRQSHVDLSMALHAAPGDEVLLRYQENGHITLPEASPGKANPGMVYVYGTWWPVPFEKLRSVHQVWGRLGIGRDQQGFLLTETAFDDGQCYQVNNGTISRSRQAAFPHAKTALEGENKWCATKFRVPSWPSCISEEGQRVLTIYWVWDWPGTPGNVSAAQYYTTCLDIFESGSA